MFKWITREIPGRKLVEINLRYSIYNKFLSHNLPLQVVGNELNISWVETKTRRQASLRHHPNSSLAFNTNRKTSWQKLKCFKEITSCPGREKLECTDKGIQVHKSTKQSRKRAAFKSVSTECSNERLQEAAVPAESRAVQPLDKSLRESGGGGGVARLTGPREKLAKSQKEIVDHNWRSERTMVGKTQGKQEIKQSTNRCFFWTQMRELESCQIHQLQLIHMVGSISTKVLVFHLYQVKSRNFMQYMNQK